MNRIVASLVCVALWLGGASAAHAAGLTVSPVQIFFNEGVKSQNLTVVNAGGDKVSVQVALKAWSLSLEGRDEYVASDELIFFPRIFELEPDEEAVLRIGRKSGEPLDAEKAYRIYLSELPVGGSTASGISMLMTLSVPIFLHTPEPTREAELGQVTLTDGILRVPVQNKGSTFFVVKDIEAVGLDGEGVEVFRQNRSGWYVLAGQARPFRLKLDPESCKNTSRVDVSISYAQTSRSATIEVTPELCTPKASDPE